MLRRFAEQLGPGEVRFSTEAVSFEQDSDGVTLVLENRSSREKETVRAAYVIAADGAHSPIRQKLGVRMLGQQECL